MSDSFDLFDEDVSEYRPAKCSILKDLFDWQTKFGGTNNILYMETHHLRSCIKGIEKGSIHNVAPEKYLLMKLVLLERYLTEPKASQNINGNKLQQNTSNKYTTKRYNNNNNNNHFNQSINRANNNFNNREPNFNK